MGLYDGQADLASAVFDTWQRSGWRGTAMGRDRWTMLLAAAIRAAPQYRELFSRRYHHEWKERTRDVLRDDYGIDPFTIALIMLAARLAIELLIWWLENRSADGTGIAIERWTNMRKATSQCPTCPS